MSALEIAFYVVSTAAAGGAILGAPPLLTSWVRRLRTGRQARTAAAATQAITVALAPVVEQIQGVADQVSDVAGRTARIEGQFYNNGGSTLRDRVDKIDVQSARTEGSLVEHLKQSAEDRQRLHDVETRLMDRP